MKKKLNLAVFVSGRGSNLRAILEHSDLRELINVKGVFSDKKDCPAFEIAREFSIPIFPISFNNTTGIKLQNELLNTLEELEAELIVLAGFLKLIPLEVTRKYHNRIINIHPALLPSFGGKGMYGMNVHRAVFNSSAKVSGATIHFVNEVYDEGLIINQQSADITYATSPEEIAETVLRIEHYLLPETIKLFALNKLEIKENRVRLLK